MTEYKNFAIITETIFANMKNKKTFLILLNLLIVVGLFQPYFFWLADSTTEIKEETFINNETSEVSNTIQAGLMVGLAGCVNECSFIGQTKYIGGQLCTCGSNPYNSCLTWNCPSSSGGSSSGGSSSGGSSSGGSTFSCTNECSYVGQRRCHSSTHYQVCQSAGSCLAWSSPISCGTGYTCQSGQCIKSCSCTSWSSWQNLGCGLGPCSSDQMRQRRTRTCTPAGCATETEYRCISHSNCKDPDLSVYCSSHPNPADISQTVTFTAYPSGGTGHYSYSWSGACSCTSKSCQTSFSSSGTRTAYVQVTSGGQTRTASCSVTIKSEPVPPTPTGLSCSPVSTSRIDLSWNSVSTATGYNIYRCTGTSCTPTSLVRTQAGTSWSNTGLSSDTVYRYRVKAYNKAGDSPYSSIVTCKTKAPHDPDLSVYCAAHPNPSQVGETVTFTAYPSGGTGHYSYSWSGACSGYSKSCHNSFSSPSTRTAYVKVTSGSQTKTASCSVTIESEPVPPTPTGLSCSSVSTSRIDLSWNTVSTATGYKIYRCTGAYCSPTTRVRTQTGTSWSNTGLSSDTVYRYRVKAYNKAGDSPYSNIVTCKTRSKEDASGYLYCYTSSSNSITVSYGYTKGSNVSLFRGTTYLTTFPGASRSGTYTDHGLASAQSYAYYLRDGASPDAPIFAARICSTTGVPTVKNVKKCYSGDVWWFSPQGERLSMYKSCDDQNPCTIDGCEDGKCFNILKCDGSTCEIGSDAYCKYCDHCGDGICNCGEDFCSCPIDCPLPSTEKLAISSLIRNPATAEDGGWRKSIKAQPGDKLSFMIVVASTADDPVEQVKLINDLPEGISFLGNLRVNDVPSTGNIVTGVNLGTLASNESKAITFDAQVGEPQYFSVGSTFLKNISTIYYEHDKTLRDEIEIEVRKEAEGVAAVGTIFSQMVGVLGTIAFWLVILLLLFILIVLSFIAYYLRKQRQEKKTFA